MKFRPMIVLTLAALFTPALSQADGYSEATVATLKARAELRKSRGNVRSDFVVSNDQNAGTTTGVQLSGQGNVNLNPEATLVMNGSIGAVGTQTIGSAKASLAATYPYDAQPLAVSLDLAEYAATPTYMRVAPVWNSTFDMHRIGGKTSLYLRPVGFFKDRSSTLSNDQGLGTTSWVGVSAEQEVNELVKLKGAIEAGLLWGGLTKNNGKSHQVGVGTTTSLGGSVEVKLHPHIYANAGVKFDGFQYAVEDDYGVKTKEGNSSVIGTIGVGGAF